MDRTALQAQGEGLGAAGIAEYRGAATATRFTDPQAEWAQMRSGCAVYDLGYRAKLSITGSDRVRWLNGMVTNNIRDLAVDHGVYAFLLNPQGHILGDLYAYNRGDSITIDTDRSQAERILATFDHYIIMDDVEVKDISGELTSVGIAGPRVRATLQKAKVEVPELQPLQLHEVGCDCDCGCVTCTIVRGDAPQIESYEIWVSATHVMALWNALLQSGATPAGFDAVELQRIHSGVPRYGIDIRDRDLPQETEQSRALNFNKGCYIGQEIVERIRSRGAVHRKFAGFLLDDAAAIEPGTRIIAGEKEAGEITSVASLQLAGVNQKLALGYIRREIAVPGREVMIGDSRATVLQLPVEESVTHGRALEHHPA